MKILVTGAASFIGCHLLKKSLGKEYLLKDTLSLILAVIGIKNVSSKKPK